MSRTQTIVQELQALGLSQVEIARRTGIPQPRLSRWGAGDLPPSADDSLKLADLLTAERAKAEGEHRRRSTDAPAGAQQ